jgi:hypothetical protein
MKISYKRGTCQGECGREDVLIVQKTLKLCQFCNQKRLTKRYNQKRNLKVKQGEKAKVPESYYKKVWAANPKVCFESGQPLYSYKNWHVHHCLHKEDYPHYALYDDVCVLLSLEYHALWHALAPSDRQRRMPNTHKRYIELCIKYSLEPEF